MFVITLSDIIGLALFAVGAVILGLCALAKWGKQRACKHPTYYETSACDAICHACGKNLGFIGTVRERWKHGRN